jgi:RNA recognition motif-containing protein
VKIYISNLLSNLSDRKISDEFENFGQILDLNIKRRTGKNYCYGYVKMKNKSAAEQAIDGIQNKKYKIKL